MVKLAVVVTMLLVASTVWAHPPIPLADTNKAKTCEAKCQPAVACTGAPSASCAAARVQCADRLQVGTREVEPDRACAATLYHSACVWDASPSNANLGDAAGCLRLARLKKTGWLFELESDPEQHRL